MLHRPSIQVWADCRFVISFRMAYPAQLSSTHRIEALALLLLLGSPTFALANTDLADCPGHIGDVDLPIECMCTPELRKIRPANVQGDGPYAWWSNICVAAVHAGVATREGGPVRVEQRDPQSEYVGTLRNGMFSNDYHGGSLPSFVVLPVDGDPADSD
ncbi:LCCL domain-containing protein [Defluviimonas sp. D31]|uniref:LCCL domain-containing protein n=1 Tax=Defluviimonas sp. D31 TaxID=3083253 RepID=UPI0039904088